MAVFVALEPSGLGERDRRAQAVLVRDGFHVMAFLVPAIWFLWHRMWIEAGLAVLIALGIGGLASWSGMPEVGVMLSLAAAILFGFEASGLRIAAYRRAGYHQWGSIEAANGREAELRYAVEAGEQDLTVAGDRWSTPVRGQATDGDREVGLVSYPWAR